MTLVLNYMRAIVCSFSGTALVPVVDTTGVSRSVSFSGVFPVGAPGLNSSYGLQVGTSGDPTVADCYSLVSPVEHGGGVGQLHYGQVSIDATRVDDDEIWLQVRRIFTNLSDSPITIREVALTANVSGYNILLSRDVIAPVEIPSMDGAIVSSILKTVL